MLKTRIIPCLDVKDGRVVKGVNFVDLVDAGDPVEAAAAYDAAGADELCFLDITATHEDRGIIFDIIERTAARCFMPLTVGGGVRTIDDIRHLLKAGADKVSINSAAVARPDFVREAAEKFGAQCIVVAIDARRVTSGALVSGGASLVSGGVSLVSGGVSLVSGGVSLVSGGRLPAGESPDTSKKWEIFTHGGRKSTGIDAVAFAKTVAALGAGEILLTSMDRDGTKAGFDLELTRTIADAVSVPVVASGGVGTLGHLVEGVRTGHASAVLAASIFHFGTHTIAEAKAHMAAAGIAVRLPPGTNHS